MRDREVDRVAAHLDGGDWPRAPDDADEAAHERVPPRDPELEPGGAAAVRRLNRDIPPADESRIDRCDCWSPHGSRSRARWGRREEQREQKQGWTPHGIRLQTSQQSFVRRDLCAPCEYGVHSG